MITEDAQILPHSLPQILANAGVSSEGVSEIQANVANRVMHEKYAKTLCVPLDTILEDSQETLDAKASVFLQKQGDLSIAMFGPGCSAVGYGMGEFINAITTQDHSGLGIGMAITSGAVWGTLGTIKSIGEYRQAWKHYNQLSPEMQKEVGRPFPLKQYAKAVAYTAKAGYHATGNTLKRLGDFAELADRGMHKGIDLVSKGVESAKEFLRSREYMRHRKK